MRLRARQSLFHRFSAFTLIEVMVVLVIILGLASVAIPTMRGTLGSTQLKSGTRGVVALMRYARSLAILREKPCEIIFVPKENTYQLRLLDEHGSVEEQRRHERNEKNALRNDGETDRLHHLPKGIEFFVIYSSATPSPKDDFPRVVYYADGSATPATIVLLNTEKRSTMNIQIYRATGMTRVEQGTPSRPTNRQRLRYGSELDE